MDQYILRFYIPMNDVIVVDEVYCMCDLSCDCFDFFLRKPSLLLENVEKVPP